MEGKQEHPKFEVPDDPHAKHRYESALKHAEYAKAAGKSSEEIHAVFKKVRNLTRKISTAFQRMKPIRSTAWL